MKNTTSTRQNSSAAASCFGLSPERMPGACRNQFERFKTKLVNQLSAEFPDVNSRLVRQAVLEADSLASLTPVPFLVLPALAEEKVLGLHNWTVHQAQIRQHAGLAFAA